MSEPTDHELLADYARTGAEPAFGRLVARYINLVHSAAARHAGSEEPAGEITQAVFLILARKAGSLAQGGPRRHAALGGWLYQTARLTAANALKAETRRQLRDHQAYMQSQENQADAAVWREIAPLLDDAMGKLGETDRNVLVLRFFEGRTNAETAAALGLAEGAVQKRVLRALEKLRASFAKQGVTHTAQAIAGTVTTNAVLVAPVGLATKVTSTVLSASFGAGAGIKILGALGKFTPFKLLISILPATIINWLSMRLDLGNFREREGFRARLFRQNSWWWIIFMTLWMAVIFFFIPRFARKLNLETVYLVTGLVFLLASANMARRLAIIRNRYFISLVITSGLAAIFCVGVGLNWIPIIWVFFFMVGISVAQIIFYGDRPLRSDYNLFLRATEKILAPDTSSIDMPGGNFPCSKIELFRFARFLGNRWLISDYRQSPDGLVLFLTPINATFWGLSWNLAYLIFWTRGSKLKLRIDGTVSASINIGEMRTLGRMRPDGFSGKNECEMIVATAVQAAWQAFLAGDVSAAERALGQKADADVFFTPTKKSLSTRLQRALMIGVAVFLLIQVFFIQSLLKSLHFAIGTPKQMAQQKYIRVMHDLETAKTEEKRFYALGAAAKESFVAGNIQAAELYAHDLLMLLPKYKNDWNYGNAIQDANLVLGRLALRNGKMDEAKKYLTAAGKSPGSPQMDSFGPNMSLANDLLEKGERQAVLEYFVRCRKFWKMQNGKLDEWSVEVEAGKIPDFGANLVY